MSMPCIKCGHEKTTVKDSRLNLGLNLIDNKVRRRRECNKCKFKYFSEEKVSPYSLKELRESQAVNKPDNGKIITMTNKGQSIHRFNEQLIARHLIREHKRRKMKEEAIRINKNVLLPKTRL